jgi:tetratricopeptide (TPR) repeat protein
MGEVYLAVDTTLDRRVALKLLPERLTTDEEAARRFMREARTAAALDHPNICAIHEVGEDGGHSFIVMQYVEGETLAAKLEREALPWPACLALAEQIAEALAEAHAHQIIHRDVKPANVVVTPRGQAKVLDFGLAKAVPTGEQIDTRIATASLLSTPGTIVGTAPYMSPEQVRGERVDARTDVWSFGVVLYEMLAGRRPFEARTSVEVLSAILVQEPPSLPEAIAQQPSLERLVRRCLEKDPARRYASMREVLEDLRGARETVGSGPELSGPRAAAPLRLEDRPPSASGSTSSPAQPALGAAGASGATETPALPTTRASLRSGLALAIALSVVVAVAAGYWMLVERRPAKPVAAADPVAETSSAYDDYLRGKVMVSEESRESNEQSIALLERAVAADPKLAPAFAELARAYNAKAFFYAPPEERERLNLDAAVAVEKALALDPDLAQAHHARGVILWTPGNRFPHEQTIRSFRRALELDPSLHETHHRLGMVYTHLGLFDEAWSEIEQAVSLNPANTLARFRFGMIHMYRGEYEEALAVLQGIPPEATPQVEANLAVAYYRLGRIEKARAIVERSLGSSRRDEGGLVTSTLAMILASTGEAAAAEQTARRAVELGEGYGHFHHTAHHLASTHALLGRSDEAVDWLEAAAEQGFPCAPCFENDQTLESLREHARFVELMARLRRQRARYLEWAS